MKVLSHRGAASESAPENTLAAFQAALDQGADGIETDVRRSRDGRLLLVHDRLLPNGRLVEEQSHEQVQQALGHGVPTLDEALREFPSTTWNLEIKAVDAVDDLIEAVRAAPPGTDILVTSFNHISVRQTAERTPVPCGLLIGNSTWDLAGMARQFTDLPNISAIVWKYDLIEPRQLIVAKQLGYQNFVWDALCPADIKRCVGLGADRLGVDGLGADGLIVDGVIVDDVPAALDSRSQAS